jgi:hypothetical protein
VSGGHSPSIFIGGLVTILVLYDIPVASMLDHADQSLTRHGSGTEKMSREATLFTRPFFFIAEELSLRESDYCKMIYIKVEPLCRMNNLTFIW